LLDRLLEGREILADSDHVDSGLAAEHLLHALTKEEVVVRDDDANGHAANDSC
jgi:hypothetical protein